MADLENIIHMDLEGGRVVIELAPDIAPNHCARIKELAREGANVAVNYRRHDTEAKQVVAEIEKMGQYAFWRLPERRTGEYGRITAEVPLCEPDMGCVGADTGGRSGYWCGRCSPVSTSFRLCSPARTPTSSRAKSIAVPGPREVITLPSLTTGSCR